MPDWTINNARLLYAITQWSDGYYDINASGEVIIKPQPEKPWIQASLLEIVDQARKEGLGLPVLLRFTDILKDRLERMHSAFALAFDRHDYTASYMPAYPIKVNQQRSVIDALLDAGKGGRVGLEAGSKSELLAIMALAPSGTLICNGYKDRAYIRLALIGRQLGHRIYIVIEKPSELELVIQESRALKIRPQLGVRIRLSSISAGKWQNSGGDKSKFGLNATDVLELVERIKQEDYLDTLELMHFHMGSQVAQIGDVKSALREAARHYQELLKLGASIRTVDVGGGLGVDYEGSSSSTDCSINYSMEEYADSIVRAFAEISKEFSIPQPNLITESGRSMTAHHAVLITNVTDVETVNTVAPTLSNSTAQPVIDLGNRLKALHEGGLLLPAYHDAQYDLKEARTMFVQGKLSLTDLAEAEQLAAAIFQTVNEHMKRNHDLRSHREISAELDDRLADKVFCNFSIFQSMPDAWAIDQIFPVMPLQRLNEAPTRRAVVQDLTCDSDGRINVYIDQQDISTTLPMHQIVKGDNYLLGIFLVGAYQEIIGDMHNLFGDTHAINVGFTHEGEFYFEQKQLGDASDVLLRYVHIDPEEIAMSYRKKLMDTTLDLESRKQYESELIAALSAYTYLETQNA